MTLAEFSHLLQVDPKWALNAVTALGLPKRYSVELARRFAVALAIHQATGGPWAKCVAQADGTLRGSRSGGGSVRAPTGTSDITLVVDLDRIRSSFNVRLSVLRTTIAPRLRGRPSARRDPLQAAADWGIDLTLLADNLGKTPEQRVRQLDAMAAFARGVRRDARLTP
jgi:hypothetical protein